MEPSLERPARDETVEYYWKYIDLVPEGSIVSILEDQRRETLSFLETIPPERALHRYAPGKWSVSELVGHVNDAERLFTMRAFWFARGHESPLPSYESDFVVTVAGSETRPWSSHIREFGAVRASTVELFGHLPPEAWSRRGVASDYPFSVRALAYIAAGHVIHHMAVLRERYL